MNDKTQVFEKIEALARSSGRVQLGVGVTEDDIQTAEAILEVTFPKSLCDFFLTYGNIQILSDDIYGLSRGLKKEFYEDECPLIDMVYFCLNERSKYKVSSSWVILMDTGEDRFYMDTCDGPEPPVIVTSAEEPAVVRRYAENFLDFLAKRLHLYTNK